MKTPTVKLEPTTVLLKVKGICGHLVLVGKVRQTTPVNAAWTGEVITGIVKRDPRSRIMTAIGRFILGH